MSTGLLSHHCKTILNKLSALRDEARQTYKADLKGIFGSVARGQATEQSDVDVLVQFSDEVDLFDWVGLGQFLEAHLNCRVDVVPETDIRLELQARILKETLYL